MAEFITRSGNTTRPTYALTHGLCLVALVMAMILDGCTQDLPVSVSTSPKGDMPNYHAIDERMEVEVEDHPLLQVEEISLKVDESMPSFTFEDLKHMSTTEINCAYSTDGTLSMLQGEFPEMEVDDAQSAFNALWSMRDLFGIDSADFSCDGVDLARNRFDVYTFDQLCKGLPVVGGRFYVCALKTGALAEVRGFYQSVKPKFTEPTLSEEDALKSVKLNDGENAHYPCLSLMKDTKDETRLVWHIDILSSNHAVREVYIDARNGELLEENTLVLT